MSRVMTKAEHAWLLDMAPRFRSWDDLLASFECAFGYQPKRQTAQCYISKHGVKLMSTTVRWLEHPEFDEFLREFVPGHGQGEIIDEFEKRFNIRLRVTQLKDRESTLGLKQGTYGGRFAPGTIPPNKGKKLTDYVKDEAKLANIRRCQFKKGEEAHNECPLGTERVSRDGYIEVKVPKEDADDRAHGWWKPKHRLIWEQVNGRKLQKGESVMFADRDMTNFDPENLVMVTQAQRLYINRNNIPYHDAESLRTAVAMAKLNEAIVTTELRPRKCPCCGKTYRPQYKAQRTCRECLESGRKARRSYGISVCQRCGATFEKLSPRGEVLPKVQEEENQKGEELMKDHSDLLDALSAIDPSTLNYQEWLDVGMALHESGLPLDAWDEWSRRDAGRYHEGECERKWRGFGSGQTRVKSGTLAKMATERGWVPPRASQGIGEALSWDGEISTALIDPSWVEPVELPETDKTGPEELVEYLGHLFDEDDIVGYVCESWDREGKWLPKSKGCYSRTAGELMRELKKYGSIEQALGSYDDRAGAWIRINPLDGKGVGNANVSEFKYALVESDTLPKEKQLALMQELQLPCAAIVDSGKKSLHAVVKVDARDYNEYRDRVMRLYDVCRKNGLDPDTQNKNPSRLSRMPGAMRSGERQRLVSGPCGKATWSEWWDWMQETTDDLPDPENLASEWDDMPELAPPLIDGVLRQGHKMLLAGPSKAGKSFALIELCVSLAEGKPWFGWECAQGRVLYVNLELDSASCLHRFKDVYRALGYAPENVKNIDIWNLRGRSVPMDRLAPSLIRRALKTRPIAVVIDPIYKVITGDENSADQMAAFCNQFDKVAQQVGCAVIYCHHHSKGLQGQKRSMDRASGSGVFARDPDALLDMTALELTDECTKAHYDWRRQHAIWAAFDKFLPEWRSDEKFVGIDSADDLQKWANEPANGAPIELRRELESIHENLQESSRGWAAWRIEGTLREFRSFKPKNLWFEYPVHLPDETGALADLKCEGEYDPRAKWTKGQEAAQKARKSVQQQKIDLIRKAMEQCAEDGVKPTRNNVLERIGKVEFEGKPFDYGALKYATGNKAKWSPFRVEEDTDILYDKNNQALDFDGEIDLSE